jgi:hypothetical protein
LGGVLAGGVVVVAEGLGDDGCGGLKGELVMEAVSAARVGMPNSPGSAAMVAGWSGWPARRPGEQPPAARVCHGVHVLPAGGLFQDLEELLGVGVDVVARNALKPRDEQHSRRGRGLVTRGLDDLLADLAEAVDAAAELVNLGKERWDAERPLRLAGEV